MHRRMAEQQQMLAGLAGSVEALRAAVAELGRPRPAIEAVYLGQERLLATHPCFPFMILDTQDLLITPRAVLQCYEPGTLAVLRRLVQPGMTVVEGGANQGYHTLTLAHQVIPGGGRVITFEARPRAYAILQDNLFALGLRSHVQAFGKAAYHENTRLTFHRASSPAGSSRVYDQGGGAIEVEAVRIGDVLAERGVRPDFVRLDVEGAEPQTLDGMWDYLETNPRIVILFEYCPPILRRGTYRSPELFLARLQGLGLKFWRVGDDGSLTPAGAEELLERYQDSYADIVAARALP
jgi:FkbM family methyltransferase